MRTSVSALRCVVKQLSDKQTGCASVRPSFGHSSFWFDLFDSGFWFRHSGFGTPTELTLKPSRSLLLQHPSFLPYALLLLDELHCQRRFYLQRGLRLRRFGLLSGGLRDVRRRAGRRSLTTRARFCRLSKGSCEPWAAMDRQKNGSGQRLAARSTRPAEPRKRVANLHGASGIRRRLAFFSAHCGLSRSVARNRRDTGRAPAKCTTD